MYLFFITLEKLYNVIWMCVVYLSISLCVHIHLRIHQRALSWMKIRKSSSFRIDPKLRILSDLIITSMIILYRLMTHQKLYCEYILISVVFAIGSREIHKYVVNKTRKRTESQCLWWLLRQEQFRWNWGRRVRIYIDLLFV